MTECYVLGLGRLNDHVHRSVFGFIDAKYSAEQLLAIVARAAIEGVVPPKWGNTHFEEDEALYAKILSDGQAIMADCLAKVSAGYLRGRRYSVSFNFNDLTAILYVGGPLHDSRPGQS